MAVVKEDCVAKDSKTMPAAYFEKVFGEMTVLNACPAHRLEWATPRVSALPSLLASLGWLGLTGPPLALSKWVAGAKSFGHVLGSRLRSFSEPWLVESC